VADVEACLEGDASAERKGDRQDAEFQVLAALDQRVEEARGAILRQTTLAQLLQDRDRLRQPAPMFYI
jgi:DNA-binding IscR family transcriptional regulator